MISRVEFLGQKVNVCTDAALQCSIRPRNTLLICHIAFRNVKSANSKSTCAMAVDLQHVLFVRYGSGGPIEIQTGRSLDTVANSESG